MMEYKFMNNKLNLIKSISPLYMLNLSTGKKNIFIKRDDLIDFGIGGNKVRLLEYIVFEALRNNVKKLITFGSVHSNHIRITSSIAKMFNLDCDVIILKNKNEEKIVEGNQLLLNIYGSNVYYCDIKEARQYIDNHLKKQNNEGIRYCFIPGGGHTAEGALGYVRAMYEIYKQCKDNDINIDTIVVPTGTGTTQAGLIYGCKLLNLNINIIGISIARRRQRCQKEIKYILDKLDKKFIKNYKILLEDVNVVDKYLDDYGEITNLELKTIKKLIDTDGIILDPIYNGKAFSTMVSMIKNDEIEEKNLLYINTGGLPNIFCKDFIERMKKNECSNN
ncbi:1-aminocyclopropane-1-carboxylate deaminase/D-cysteine desulfhydrase [Haloimpatiens sp. FM7330]|uniref:1-aminocyclopropane-1-carboxylate deaminase/D-cysteine desulfhydrase n=1 Tax=Haloimpatiens sp. FM7330 TaxID=3298610 RepID=UPI003644EF1F